MTRSTAVAVAIAGALALTLGACSSGPAGGDEDGPTPEREPLPLDALWDTTSGTWDEVSANAQQMEMEERTAECMAREGFEDTPVDWSQGGMVSIDLGDLDVARGSREFAERYGYGVTTNPWGDQIAEPLPEETPGDWIDPNQEYLESMSDVAREADYIALHGDPSTSEDSTGTSSTRSCVSTRRTSSRPPGRPRRRRGVDEPTRRMTSTRFPTSAASREPAGTQRS